MNNRIKISSIIGAVFVLATILIFVLAYPVVFPGTVLGFCFLLYSEVVFFGGFAIVEYWASKSSGIMTCAGMGGTISTYAVFVFVSSLFYMNTHVVRYRGFLILQIILFVLAVTISTLFAFVSKSKALHDEKTLKADAVARSFIDDLENIRNLADKKTKIDKLVEAIRYSDTSSMADADVEIDEAILQLKNTVAAEEVDETQFDKCVEKIEFLIRKRNLQIKSLKQGGI